MTNAFAFARAARVAGLERDDQLGYNFDAFATKGRALIGEVVVEGVSNLGQPNLQIAR